MTNAANIFVYMIPQSCMTNMENTWQGIISTTCSTPNSHCLILMKRSKMSSSTPITVGCISNMIHFLYFLFICPIVLRVYLSNHFLILRSSWVHSLWRFTMVFSNCWFGKIEQNRYFDFRYGMVGSISSSTSSCSSTIMGKITPGMKWKVPISRGLVHWK